MKKIYLLFGSVLLAFCLILSAGQAQAQNTWTVYDATVLPTEATPPFAASNFNPGVTETAPAIVATEHSIIDNPDMPGGKVLRAVITGTPHTRAQWRRDLTEGTTAITVATKVKGVADVQRIFDMDLDFGGFRETVTIYPDGTYNLRSNSARVSLGVNFDAMAWHTYRFTKSGNVVNLYVDENNTPIASIILPATATGTGNYFRWGDGNTDPTYGALYDWVAWDFSGAYSPSQRALPDMGGGGTTTPKKVAYVTTPRTNLVEGAAPSNNDPLIRMLNADPNIALTVFEVAADATVDLSGFDAVIAQESFGSGAAIFKPGGSLALASIPVPFIFNKSYAFRSTGAIPGGTGAASEAGGTAITVPMANRNNDLFKGLTFTNDTVQIFKSMATDNGGVPGTKSFNFSSGLEISNPNTLLATHAGITAPQTTVYINDVPAGTTFGPATAPQTTRARMIAIGMNYGAIVKDNGANWTAAGLTLWRNAVYSLVGLPVPNSLVNPNVVITSLASETRNAAFNLGQNYPNPFNGSTTIEFELKKAGHVTLEVYDITGKRVALLANDSKTAGAHEIKFNTNLRSGIYFYKLNANGATATRKMVVTR